MQFSFKSFMHSHQRLVSAIIGLGILSVSAVALAAIVSGTSTTNISAHVTFTQLTINKPTVAAGDVMIASIAVNDGTIVNVTAPAGWTQIARTDNDINVALISYYKVASASEPSTYTWIIDEQTKAVGGITPYSNVDTTNPIDAAVSSTGFGTVATTSVTTTTAANEEIVALFATDVNKSFSAPTGMTAKYSIAQSGGPTTSAFDAPQAAAGAVASKSSTIAGNKPRDWAAQQIALRPTPPRATLLERSSSQYWSTDYSASSALNFSSAASTVSLWANFASIASDSDDYLAVKGTYVEGGSNDLSISIYYQYPNLVYCNFDASANQVCANTPWTPSLNTWYLLTFAVDTSGNLKFYVNGAQQGSTWAGMNTVIDTDGKRFAIGARTDLTDRTFDGSIDDVRVWTRAISDTEVSSLYANPNSFNNGANLAAWWNFTGNGDDSSGGGNGLTGVNGPAFTANVPY